MNHQIFILLVSLFVLLFTPFAFIACDFWSGIRKAKERGEKITSDGFRRTIMKAARYYNFLLALLAIDIPQMLMFFYTEHYYGWHVPVFPFLLFVGVIIVGIIETKSIYEKAGDKTRKDISDVASLGREIALHRDELVGVANALNKYLNTGKDEPE